MYQSTPTVLEDLAVDFERHLRVLYRTERARTCQDWTQGCKSIECFASSELTTTTLRVLKHARRQIIAYSVSQDIVVGVLYGNVSSVFRSDNRKFSLRQVSCELTWDSFRVDLYLPRSQESRVRRPLEYEHHLAHQALVLVCTT